MNQTIDLILSHRSIRQFTAEPISSQQLDAILAAAQSASTSSFLQVTSIIRVTGPEARKQLAQLAGNQPYVEQAAEFLVFCADYHRHGQIVPDAQTGYAEQLLIGAIDGAIMGQNALLAAQSLGLGGVYIGGLRNHPAEVSELLGLPDRVIPLFGLCLGHPAQQPEQKPRLPRALVVHQESYQREPDRDLLAHYDQQIEAYYQARSSNNKQQTWSGQIRAILTKESRPFMLGFLQSRGFNLK
ncbi:oxygen-insensitive NADPH nitroreductase [Aeromonas jandaei]|uniref:oxygen-insensitive NADPH nitroreductase n=1 Tax=Aeromonas jandaei TaxID=650 RepID=UPI0019341BC4|nr:oxygen-insensitive NADPH nitroreductase [Aeromonas jandaei]MBM0491360.1 oxygen-insensitive NADPH nitroreductase [Aeromonas jandaei]MBM0568106.1 oxygen-insensitive NADPH nitroreductase [Aeromonas jandaei]